mmetsp:Transcript_46350/g.96949  ORF Transcript_46350/g.96949 Transcript_46350/m.96949 type:complete len:112 (-) Transcript_46350:75-410(-)
MRLTEENQDGGDENELIQRNHVHRHIPWRPVILASSLFCVGSILLLIAGLITVGAIDAAYWWPGQAWTQPAIACFVLGGLSFMPGAYAVYIAVRAYRGDPGFSFDMIPTVQ